MVVPTRAESRSPVGWFLDEVSRAFYKRSLVRLVCFGPAFISLLVWTPTDYFDDLTPQSIKVGENALITANKEQTTQSPNATNRHSQRNPYKEQLIIKASELPDASNWTATKETPYEVCFLTSVYSSSVKSADHPPNVQEMKDKNPTFEFLAFTNLPGLIAPAWTVTVKNFTQYRRYITQSRWPKFLGWKDGQVHGCQAVFYMDGFCAPKLKHSQRYKRLAKAIHESEYGIFQNKHEDTTGPLHELDRILDRKKDIQKNIEASKAWLLAQPDFHPNCTMYANHYIGYNPKSEHFQQASQFFWDHYSLEQDSWRDQPLWSYVLDKYNIHPPRLGTFEALFREYWGLMAKDGHRYNDKADSNAEQSVL